MLKKPKKRAPRTAPPSPIFLVVALAPYQRKVFTMLWNGPDRREAERSVEWGRKCMPAHRHWQVIEIQPKRIDDV